MPPLSDREHLYPAELFAAVELSAEAVAVLTAGAAV